MAHTRSDIGIAERGVEVVLLIANCLPVDICHHLIVRSRSDAVISISLAYRSRP